MKKTLKKAAVLTCISSLFLTGQAFAWTTEFTNTDTTNSSYNRQAAADYAVKYAPFDSRNTNYANYGDNLDGGDCTNFASQVLHDGGGLPFHGTKGYNRNTVDWYYYGPDVPPATNPRTSSWTGAHQFREHWGVVNGTGGKYAYEMKKYTIQEAYDNFGSIYTDLWNGDIVQYVDSTGTTYHSQAVWNYGSGWMNVAQHSVNGAYWGWDLNLKTEIQNRIQYGGWFITLKIKQASS